MAQREGRWGGLARKREAALCVGETPPPRSYPYCWGHQPVLNDRRVLFGTLTLLISSKKAPQGWRSTLTPSLMRTPMKLSGSLPRRLMSLLWKSKRSSEQVWLSPLLLSVLLVSKHPLPIALGVLYHFFPQKICLSHLQCVSKDLLGSLFAVSKLIWYCREINSSLKRFRNSFGNGPPNADKERERG